MRGTKTLKINVFIIFVALVGIAWCYHHGAITAQAVWSGAMITAIANHIFLTNELYHEEEEEEE